MKVLFTALCLVPTLAFAQGPLDIVGLDERVEKLESRVDAIEAKLAPGDNDRHCDCPCNTGGVCVCRTGECPNVDCPKSAKNANVEYVDITKGRHVLLFTASWCPTCPAAKERLGDLLSEVVSVDMDERPDLATEYNVTGIPAAVLVEDGRTLSRCVGQHVGKTIVGGWLNPVSKSTNQYSGSPQYYSAPTYQYSPRYYSTPNYFQGYSSGGCATCR